MTFEEKINNLNPQQRKAVESIEGPVMVIAGPGTGKTEILSLRIGYILKNAQVSPGNILCLTYTDAAATEMRHRLIEYIGPEAYKLQVSTFHGFCNLVIQENPGIFQQARELEPISDIDKFKLLQELIDGFGPDHALKRFKGNTYNDWTRLNNLFATMKKENWSVDHMHQHIREYIERKRGGDEFIYKRKSGENKAGDFKEAEFRKKVLEPMEVLHAAVREYDHYNALLSERGQYDFDDMLMWVNEAFGRNADLLANYQERFLYFLVDEFQDTNGIQIYILQKLIEHEWLEQPNVFVVGDDDQAIYRFQGANIENLVQFQRRYNPDIIVLNQNYRSSQIILDASRVVMQPVEANMMQQIFKQQKTLTASGPYAALNYNVQLISLPNVTFENATIYKQLKDWHESNLEGEVAVLYTKHELGRELAQALKGAGIPFHTSRSVDALHQPLVLHLLDILLCIHKLADGADNDDGLLYRNLHLRYLHPNTSDLQRLILAFTAKPKTDTSTLFMWMGDAEKVDAMNLQNKEWLQWAYQLFENGIIEYHSRTLLSFVEWIIHHFGVMAWILQQPEKFTLLYTLKTFYSFVEDESAGKKSFDVADLLEICDLMTTYNIRLPVNELAHKAKGIHLSTLHGAKGLEFDKVIIKNLTDNEWEKRRKNYSGNFSFPDNLTRQESLNALLESSLDADDQDRRRLLYVGMTRAKQELTLTYATAKDDGKGMTPSQYLAELLEGHPEIKRTNEPVNESIQGEYLAALMSGEQRPDLHIDQQEIRERVKNYVLNVSALNTYLECPVRFYYDKILVVPAGEAAHLIFGNALHFALNRYFIRRFDENETTVGKTDLQELYSWYLDRNRHRFTQKELADYKTYGERILGQFYDRYSGTWSEGINYKVEFDIQNVHIDGIPVRGFIDRIDRIGNSIIVYDYKSGAADSISKKMKGPDGSDEHGGNYWRQMVFYDLLLREDPRFRQGMTSGHVLALEPSKDGIFAQKSIEVTDEDRQFVRQQLKDVYQKIQALEFHTGCGECDWCRMHELQPVILNRDEDSSE